jgi:hypothetical protein
MKASWFHNGIQQSANGNPGASAILITMCDPGTSSGLMANRIVIFHFSPLSTAVVRHAVCPALLLEGYIQPSILSPEDLRTSIVNWRLLIEEFGASGTVPVFGCDRDAFFGRNGSVSVR